MNRLRAGMVAAAVLLAAAGCGEPAPAPASPSASADPKAVRVVALGDSVLDPPDCGCELPVTQYASKMEERTGKRVVGTNLAVGGSTAQDLATQLASDADVRAQVAASRIVLVVTGANDVAGLAGNWDSCAQSCMAQPVADMSTNLGKVLEQVHQLRAGKPTKVLVANYWNVLSDGAVARNAQGAGFVAWTHQLTDLTNAAIAKQAKSHGDTMVDLVSVFRGKGDEDPTNLLAEDGDHPNPAGVRAMVLAFVQAS